MPKLYINIPKEQYTDDLAEELRDIVQSFENISTVGDEIHIDRLYTSVLEINRVISEVEDLFRDFEINGYVFKS
jgi:hypothetical protein